MFVDPAKLSCNIKKKFFFSKSDLKYFLFKLAGSEFIKLNACYFNVVYTTDRIIEPASKINFCIIHYDTISSPFSLFVFYREIYVRVFLNFVPKDLMNLTSDCVNSGRSCQVNLPNYKKN